MKRIAMMGLAAVAAVGATACSSMNTRTSSAWRKAPLTVPPEYNLRRRPPVRPARRNFPLNRRRVSPCSALISARQPARAAFIKAAGIGDAVDRSVRSGRFRQRANPSQNRGFADMIFSFGSAAERAAA